MTTIDSRAPQVQRATRIATIRIEEAMGYLEDAARLVGNGSEFHQVIYDLDKAISRAKRAADID